MSIMRSLQWFFSVIASVAKQSSAASSAAGLLRRFAPRNDAISGRQLQSLAGEEAERFARLRDRRLGGFGSKGELLGADDGHVVDTDEAEQVADVRLLAVHRRPGSLAVKARAALDQHRLLARHQPFRALGGVAKGDSGAKDVVEPGFERRAH